MVQELISSLKSHQMNLDSLKPLEIPNEVEKKEEMVQEGIIAKVEEIIQPVVEKKKIAKNRCYMCDKRTGIYGHVCKCLFTYCSVHRLPEEHECEFNHAKVERERLEKKLVKVHANK